MPEYQKALCAGPGSINVRRAKRGLTGSGLVRHKTSIRREGLTDALSENVCGKPFRHETLAALDARRQTVDIKKD